MFDPNPGYAPDLEWMLQSGQVSRDILLEALVFEFYAPVFHLALAILDDYSAAQHAADDAFSRALVEIYKYRSQDGVEIWLFRIALVVFRSALAKMQTHRSIKAHLSFLRKPNDFGESLPNDAQEAEIWLGIDQLDSQLRLTLLLHDYLEWQTTKIALSIGESEDIVQAVLEDGHKKIRDQVITQLAVEEYDQAYASKDFHALIRHSLQKRWPPKNFSQTELERVISRISRRARLIGNRKRGVISFVELAIIVLIILIGTGLAWGMDYFGSQSVTPSPTQRVSTAIITKIVFQYITATPKLLMQDLVDTEVPFVLPRDLFAYARSGEHLEEAAERLEIPAKTLQELNRIPSGIRLQSGQRLLIPERWEYLVFPRNTPVPKIDPVSPLSEPILSKSVLQRFAIQGPRYNTVWFDARIIDYGPLSYIGPARVFHSQYWESAAQSLALVGGSNQLPNEVMLRLDQTSYLAKPGENAPWFSEWRELGGYSSPTISLLSRAANQLFNTSDLERGTVFDVIGREEQAGVQSLILDVIDPQGERTDRIWYDDSRGFILRRISYYPGERELPEFEVQVTSVIFDADFPMDLFDTRIPWRGGFAINPDGDPAPLNNRPFPIVSSRPRRLDQASPPGIDPAQSRLYFQYPPSTSSISLNTTIELFIDKYSLGRAYFGDPWEMVCDRSPDGMSIAFVSRPVNASDSESILKWFSLSDPAGSYYSFHQHLGVTEFAFAPDSHRIAYFSRSSKSGMGVLGIANIDTRKDQPLLLFGDVKSLVWHPDGKSLAMIARADSSTYYENVTVIDTISGKITYSAPIDIISNAVRDWPMFDWGVEFPVEMEGMDGCAQPPSQ